MSTPRRWRGIPRADGRSGYDAIECRWCAHRIPADLALLPAMSTHTIECHEPKDAA